MPPRKSGFGTTVVRELVPYELGGSVEPEYRPEGFRCRLKIPGHWLADMPTGEVLVARDAREK